MSSIPHVMVVGAGPVGLATALRLADHGIEVTLVDGGGPGLEPPGAELNRGRVLPAFGSPSGRDGSLVEKGTLFASRDHLAEARYRGVGGNAWRWGVRWRPGSDPRVRLVAGDIADFEARADFDIPGWVAPAKTVVSRYDEALAFFGLEGHTFDVHRYLDAHQAFALSDPPFPTRIFHFGLADLIRTVRVEEALQHPGIQVRTGANLVGIDTGGGGDSVASLIFSDSAGNESRLRADHYILALGGVENARQLLLAVEDGQLQDRHDVIGRWFMAHPHTRFGYLDTGKDPEVASWYDFQLLNGTPVLRGHEIDPASARSEGLLRFSLDIVGRHPDDATRTGHGAAMAYDAVRARDLGSLAATTPALLRSPRRTARLVRQARTAPIHNSGIGGWSDPASRYHPVGALAVEAMLEQRPSPDNRVQLGSKRSRFGRRLPELHWSWSRREIESIQRSVDLVRGAVDTAGIGRLIGLDELGQGSVPRAGSGAHHIGGTRQSESPEDGVVTAENRMHDVDNLSVAGCSVFPNSVGYANPTLTAVADALRVADLLAGLHP